jgi:FAD/FMN-containing dehydrogenase
MASNESFPAFPTLSSASKVTFSTQGQISRWSNTGLSPNGCAVIIVPSTEEDIISVVKFAAENNLKVLPTAGKHGSFLPVNERSIYLDLTMFDTVELDEKLGCVNIGGGVVAGRMSSALAEQGWYTSKLPVTCPRQFLAHGIRSSKFQCRGHDRLCAWGWQLRAQWHALSSD